MQFFKKHNGLRAFIYSLALIVVFLVSFLLGLRSAIQKDRAYFWTKEIKIIAYHEYNLLKDRFRLEAKSGAQEQAGEVKVFTANDFSLELIHLDQFGHTEKTAGFVHGALGKMEKYEQSNTDGIWVESRLNEVITDAEPTRFRGGGLKQVFNYRGQILGLVSMVGPDHCYFASLVNITQRKEVFRAPCLPNVDELDFSSIGGAWAEFGSGLLLSLGTPSDDERIAGLAQDVSSPYGKILNFSAEQIAGNVEDIRGYSIHSMGHRNPQGMYRFGDSIYAVDHGPKGGDEINLLEQGKNYGWPIYSLGSTYQGKPHLSIGDSKKFTEPLFSFVPSIAPSDITGCPKALSLRYAPLTCVMISSLRGMSLVVGLIDANNRVISLERIVVDMRLREFIHMAGDRIAISTDDNGVFEIKIEDLAAF